MEHDIPCGSFGDKGRMAFFNIFCSISEMLIHGSNDLEGLAVERGE